jgi:hypothetical protein
LSLNVTHNIDVRNLIWNVSILSLSWLLSAHVSLPYVGAALECILNIVNCIFILISIRKCRLIFIVFMNICLTTLFITYITSILCILRRMIGWQWIMNWKSICPDWENHDNSVKTVGVPVEVRIVHFPNAARSFAAWVNILIKKDTSKSFVLKLCY